jgi:phosphinothricin acetyltransferase
LQLGSFRAYPAYKYTVEHSVYVHPQHRGRGLGQQLMELLIAEARQRGDVHVLVGAIDAANAGSIALHKRLGFESVGLMPQVGFKFGRWLDLAFYHSRCRRRKTRWTVDLLSNQEHQSFR